MFLVTVLRFHHSIPVKFIFQFCHSLDENPFFIMTDHFTEFVKRTTSRMPAQEIPFWQQAPECIQILCGSGHNALLLLRQRSRWLLIRSRSTGGDHTNRGMQKQDSYNFQNTALSSKGKLFPKTMAVYQFFGKNKSYWNYIFADIVPDMYSGCHCLYDRSEIHRWRYDLRCGTEKLIAKNRVVAYNMFNKGAGR